MTLTCASPAGHALIGRGLYLPADWAADEERRELHGTVIPEPRRDKPHRHAWFLWRRRHQYWAQQAHQRWHA